MRKGERSIRSVRGCLLAFHRDEGAQLIYLIVLSICAFACLVGLVMNTGHDASIKVDAQNAADTTSISGTTWVARGLNIVSMNNVAMTQLLGMSTVIRAFADTVKEGLETARKYLPIAQACSAVPYIGALCRAWAVALQTTIRILTPLDQTLNQSGLADRLTDPNNGVLWNLMRVLDGANTATVKGLPLLAQTEASKVAELNRSKFGFLCPLLYTAENAPAKAGDFDDLCEPTELGSPSKNQAQKVDRRGYHTHPGLQYALDVGPLRKYRDNIDPFIWPLLVPIFKPNMFVDKTREVFGSFCGGAGGSGRPSNPPKPHLLEGVNGDDLSEAKRRLSCIGVAYRDHETLIFPGVFKNTRPGLLTYAQSRVFNPTSWDLFTQDWQVKLVPVDEQCFQDQMPMCISPVALARGAPHEVLSPLMGAMMFFDQVNFH